MTLNEEHDEGLEIDSRVFNGRSVWVPDAESAGIDCGYLGIHGSRKGI